MAPLIEEVAVDIDAVRFRQVFRNQLADCRQVRLLLGPVVLHVLQTTCIVGPRLLLFLLLYMCIVAHWVEARGFGGVLGMLWLACARLGTIVQSSYDEGRGTRDEGLTLTRSLTNYRDKPSRGRAFTCAACRPPFCSEPMEPANLLSTSS